MKNYFEGKYFKHQKDGFTLSVIAGRARECAFIQIITDENSYRVRYPLRNFRKIKNHSFAVGDSLFTPYGIKLRVKDEGVTLCGTLKYRNLSPIKYDIMGPFAYLPMQCKHTVESMSHEIYGHLSLNGRIRDFTGGKGYTEGDSGRSFPKSYTWAHCNAFKGNCSVMASAAHIPFAFSHFAGCIAIVLLDGKEYRLATYLGAKIKQNSADILYITQRNLSLKIKFLSKQSGHTLDSPVSGEMSGRIREVPAAPAIFELRKDRQLLFREKSDFASFEHVE